MRYLAGRTWELPDHRWERFEVTIDEDDLAQWCASRGFRTEYVSVKLRHLIVRTLAEQIEAIETHLRSYMPKEQRDEIVQRTNAQLEQLAVAVERGIPLSG